MLDCHGYAASEENSKPLRRRYASVTRICTKNRVTVQTSGNNDRLFLHDSGLNFLKKGSKGVEIK